MTDIEKTKLSRRQFLQVAGVTGVTAVAPIVASAEKPDFVKVQNVNYARWNLNATFSNKYRAMFQDALDTLLKLDPRTVFNALIMVESQDNQFDRYGRTLTSPANAYGAAQVLLTTAHGVAKKAGKSLDVQAFMKDENYNKEIGYRYFLEMREFFGGNNVLALMAYNGGPGGTIKRIDNYGEKLEPTGASMLEFISSVVNRENRLYPIKTALNLNLVDLKKLGSDFKGNQDVEFAVRSPGPGYNNGYSAQLFRYRKRYNLPTFDEDVLSPTSAFKLGMQILPITGKPGSYELRIGAIGTQELKIDGSQLTITPPNNGKDNPYPPVKERGLGVQELKIQ